jgi:hypothetical protein
MLASNAADGIGGSNQLRFFSLKSCLPTASGCHFQEAAISERRRLWAALNRGNPLDVYQSIILVAQHPMNLRPARVARW